MLYLVVQYCVALQSEGAFTGGSLSVVSLSGLLDSLVAPGDKEHYYNSKHN